MAGAVVIWIVRFGQPGNAVIPGVVLLGLTGIAWHGVGVDRDGSDR